MKLSAEAINKATSQIFLHTAEPKPKVRFVKQFI